ncbi:hypothetical protein SAMN05216267_1008193 [Actinacidiphila rubida]|uniref:Lipoprotein n=1 Tax=Actinacidiphila rubida TaxID=310780 RepID=A0A1H8IR36_9ACTN|nr:hypothetical protein SAMN05216267_1008193 [Actinacidiphila rubida]
MRAVAAAVLLGLTAGVAGCDASHSTAPSPAVTDPELRHLFDTHASALLHRDRTAFLAGIDPQARRYRARQQAVFANLAQVPLASWSYGLVRTDAFPLPPAADGVRRTAAEVRLDYRLSGYDTQPVETTEYVTLTRRAGHWYFAGDDDGTSSGHRSDVQLWDQGPVRVAHGAHSLVLGLAPDRALREYAADADRAVPAVTRSWGTDWPRRVVVEAPATLAQMAALLNVGATAYQGIAAVTTGELGVSAAPADRVLVNPEAFGLLSAFGKQVVLTHETTHVATRRSTDDHTPLWLSEGTADWVAYRDSGRGAPEIAPELAGDVRAGRVPGALPDAADFKAGSAKLAQAYEGAWLACRMIADQWSPQTLTAFYRAVAQGGTLDAHLHGALGLSTAEFTARWQAYLRKELA